MLCTLYLFSVNLCLKMNQYFMEEYSVAAPKTSPQSVLCLYDVSIPPCFIPCSPHLPLSPYLYMCQPHIHRVLVTSCPIGHLPDHQNPSSVFFIVSYPPILSAFHSFHLNSIFHKFFFNFSILIKSCSPLLAFLLSITCLIPVLVNILSGYSSSIYVSRPHSI